MRTRAPASHAVAAVVVGYEPDESLLERNLRSIAPQVDRIYLVDNSTAFRAEEFCTELDLDGLRCIALGSNRGIAAALNRGIQAADQDGLAFVLLLDQDSESSPDLVRQLLSAYGQLDCEGSRVAAVGSRALDRTTRYLSNALHFGWFSTRSAPCPEGEVVPVEFLITSGTLIPLEALRKVGGMREDLFIDHVDTEWLLRARSRGYAAYLCCSAHIVHAMGERRLRVWAGRWRNAPLHKPFRYYYLFRNYLLLLRQKRLSRKWKFMESQRLMQMIFFLVIFSHERRSIAYFIAKGILDGLRNKGGRIDF